MRGRVSSSFPNMDVIPWPVILNAASRGEQGIQPRAIFVTVGDKICEALASLRVPGDCFTFGRFPVPTHKECVPFRQCPYEATTSTGVIAT
jgi:hypothetical protein